ncbi:urease accessory UreF family protein [Sulfolobus sp. S-194]|uniref:urease accessory protein UreF n=1 Tax=Sulfolobus sp. S-194 TaxID=2512240 RepID=UPI002570A1B9|nr:urease accessory UreF family protein [Sulfolobus sp. S-194]
MLTPKIFQLFDSALPVGSFNYSFGVEEAYMKGFEIRGFIRDIFFNVIMKGDIAIIDLAYEDPEEADKILYASKLPKELKEASVNMGLSLARLELCDDYYIKKVNNGEGIGTYPVIIARCCKSLGISKEDCKAGLAYTELSQLVFSAVRLRAIDFIEGQKTIWCLLSQYKEEKEFEPFSPVLDILSKLHEEREPRVFLA